MLARSSILRHKSGDKLVTPILLPSFSSKGFDFFDNDGQQVSEIAEIFNTAKEWITDCFLASAYDIYHKHIPLPENFPTAKMYFIDSGGYENRADYDFAVAKKLPIIFKEWKIDFLKEVYASWPAHRPAVIVNFDNDSHSSSIKAQINNALELFADFPDQLHDFVIHPESNDFINPDEIMLYTDDLSKFDVLGFTEKELGDSMLDRMKNIAKIRIMLDNKGVKKPLHIFGSLDPISSCLYFLSGAEIFDGLTWLRYSYFKGLTIYPHNYGALEHGIHQNNKYINSKNLVDNLNYLSKLYLDMKGFLVEADFMRFTYHSNFLEKSYHNLCCELGGKM